MNTSKETMHVVGRSKAWMTQYGSMNIEQDPDSLVTSVVYTDRDMTSSGWYIVGEAEIALTLLGREDSVLNQIDSLKGLIRQEHAQSHSKVMELQDQINNLLAITYAPSVGVDVREGTSE